MAATSTEPPPAGTVPIRLDAGQAFGSGEHDSTRGCLLALDRLARRRRLKRVLDLGCGAGILAIAAAKCWPARVIAADNDPIAVAVAHEQRRRQRRRRPGALPAQRRLRQRRAARSGPFDLILANILADPLCAMARDDRAQPGAGRRRGALRPARPPGGQGACRPPPLRPAPARADRRRPWVRWSWAEVLASRLRSMDDPAPENRCSRSTSMPTAAR